MRINKGGHREAQAVRKVTNAAPSLDGSIQDTRGEVNQNWIIQGIGEQGWASRTTKELQKLCEQRPMVP